MRLTVGKHLKLIIVIASVLLGAFMDAGAQTPSARSLEVSEQDGVPVLIKHLPDAGRSDARFIKSAGELRAAFGDRSILAVIDFSGGTEAAAASYPAGKLLIVEYTNPQGSIDADQKILQKIAAGGPDLPTVYRRIGNYNAFVFDGADASAAAALLDQIKYEKDVQWLGEDPFLLKHGEKYFVTTTRDIFISTVLVIFLGIGGSIVAGIVAGYFYFLYRDRRRSSSAAFSDAGGLTRLNIDDLTSEGGAD